MFQVLGLGREDTMLLSAGEYSISKSSSTHLYLKACVCLDEYSSFSLASQHKLLHCRGGLRFRVRVPLRTRKKEKKSVWGSELKALGTIWVGEQLSLIPDASFS